MFSFNITRRNLTEDFLFIVLLPVFKLGIFKVNLSLVEFLWNNVQSLLVTLEDNLFALNHSHIFCNSQYTVPKSVSIF